MRKLLIYFYIRRLKFIYELNGKGIKSSAQPQNLLTTRKVIDFIWPVILFNFDIVIIINRLRKKSLIYFVFTRREELAVDDEFVALNCAS